MTYCTDCGQPMSFLGGLVSNEHKECRRKRLAKEQAARAAALADAEAEAAKKRAAMQAEKNAVLQDTQNGIIPQQFHRALLSSGYSLPINLQKGEQVVWAFPNTKYLEDKIHREYVGGSAGVSFRVMKGVYYRTGGYRGHSVEHLQRDYITTGTLFVTDKNIYFAGGQKSLRLPYSKIVSYQPYTDGVGITRDAVSAKPQTFVTGEGPFTFALMRNLSNRTTTGDNGQLQSKGRLRL